MGNLLLEVKNLHASIENKEVLKGLNLSVKAGEVHAIMGPNGSGKSTLSKVIAGHPSYEVTKGEVLFEVNGKMTNLLEAPPDERAKEGVFLAFQYPVEIPGVSNFQFLMTAFNAICAHQGTSPLEESEFRELALNKMKSLSMRPEFLDRAVNAGFSGGEKKRNEILQMAILSPRLSFLDETDSGLDIDALKIVAEGVQRLRSSENAIVLVTHYHRLLDHVKPDFVHVLAHGQIVKSGASDLALELEQKGYDWVTS